MQKKALFEYQKALQEWKTDKNSESIIQILIQCMSALYPDIQIDNKLENQAITDEIIDKVIEKINVLRLQIKEER